MSKIRVMVVDDSVLMRTAISHILGSDPDIEVAGVAANGRLAIAKMDQLAPDLVTLDVEMPDMDGLETLAALKASHPHVKVIMLSSLTRRGGEVTLKALAEGAVDYVAKPGGGDPAQALEALSAELIPKIKIHGRDRPLPVSLPAPPAAGRPRTSTSPIQAVCIGTSTGGPNALARLFAGIPSTLGVPLFIVQHMPPMFTQLLAERLNANSKVPVVEGQDGVKVKAGWAYIAPGGRHMDIRREGKDAVIRLHDQPPENSCRPAADVLFRSVASAYGAGTLAVVLTGMGQDGLRGCQAIHEKGGRILAQDEATSTVWGMPRAVIESRLAEKVVPLESVSNEILAILRQNAAERLRAG